MRDDDLDDVIKEERSRGRRQPVRASSLADRRKVQKLAELLGKHDCDEREFLQAIRDLGLKDGSEPFLRLVALWREHRGRS